MDTKPDAGRIFYGWWIVLAVGLVGLWAGTVFYGITAFINPIARDMRWSYLSISVAMSLRSLEMGFLSPLTGYLSDKIGARKVVIFAAITVGLGYIILSRLDSLFTFYAGFIVLSIGLSGIGHSATLTPIANWFNKNLGKAMGLAMIGYGLSGVFIPIITALIEAWHWRSVFVLLGILTWLTLIPASFLLKQKPETYGLRVDGLPPEPHDDCAQSGPADAEPQKSSRYWALRTRSFWMLSLAVGVFSMVLNMVALYMLPYLESKSVDTGTAAMIVMFIPLASVPGRFFIGWLGDVMDKRLSMAASFALMALSLLIVYMYEEIWLYYVFVVLFGLGFGGIFSLRSSIIREYFGRHCFGSVQGMSTPIMVLGGLAGPPLAGWIFDTQESLRLTWLICMLLSLGSIPLVLAMGSARPVDPRHRQPS